MEKWSIEDHPRLVPRRPFSGRGRPNTVVVERRFGTACLASLATHVGLVAIALLAIRGQSSPVETSPIPVAGGHVPLVWLNRPGPGGGGGGGGNRTVAPPRKAELAGTDPLTVPAGEPPTPDRSAAPTELEPIPRLNIPVATLALGIDTLPGAIGAPPATLSTSQGPGHGGGAGPGIGTGDGPGRGSGVGDGSDSGIGGDVYRPGNGITLPIEIRKGAPRYTAEAMNARAQGTITVECVVQTTGVCTNIRVTRSLNPAFGLDQEAIKAAAQWRFRPGTRQGRPVPVLVTMEIAFAVR